MKFTTIAVALIAATQAVKIEYKPIEQPQYVQMPPGQYNVQIDAEGKAHWSFGAAFNKLKSKFG